MSSSYFTMTHSVLSNIGYFKVVREMSAYSHPTLLIGIFSSMTKALDARHQYITQIRSYGDPYKEQAYFKVDIEDDVAIYPQNVWESSIISASNSNPQELPDELYCIVYSTKVHEMIIKDIPIVTSDASMLPEMMKDIEKESLTSKWPFEVYAIKVHVDQMYNKHT